jgi:hypothetical protein
MAARNEHIEVTCSVFLQAKSTDLREVMVKMTNMLEGADETIRRAGLEGLTRFPELGPSSTRFLF